MVRREVAVPLGGRQQRCVLAVLLTNANQTVSTDRLVDDVWGDDPPETARRSLQASPGSVVCWATRRSRRSIPATCCMSTPETPIGSGSQHKRGGDVKSCPTIRSRPRDVCARRWRCGVEPPLPTRRTSRHFGPQLPAWRTSGRQTSKTASRPTWPGCWLYKQASFAPADFPMTTRVGVDVRTFPFPLMEAPTAEVVLGGGEFVVALLDDRPVATSCAGSVNGSSLHQESCTLAVPAL